MTKYEVIFKDIRKKIENGTFPVNAKLPTEPELGDQYKVSRITVKKAIDQLVAVGLVIKRRGGRHLCKGPFRAGRPAVPPDQRPVQCY